MKIVRWMRLWGRAFFTSLGQIMLQNSPLTGGLFFIAVAISSLSMALMMSVATIVALASARLLRLSWHNFNAGLYGFSAALVGLAMAMFVGNHWLALALSAVGALLAMLMQEWGLRYKLPLYTLPFIVVSWLMIALAEQLHISAQAPAQNQWLESFGMQAWASFADATMRSVGQVMFLSSSIAGLLCWLGLAVNRIKSALLVLLATTLVIVVLYGLGGDNDVDVSGLWGFNSVLVALALFEDKAREVIWISVGVIVALFIQWGFGFFAFFDAVGSYFTLPFVLAVWVVLGLKKLLGLQAQ